MSKFARIILVNLATILCFSVVGCGKDAAGSFSSPTKTPVQSATVAPTGTQAATPTANAQTQTPTQAPTATATANPTTTPTVVEGEGAVLWQVAVPDALTMSYVIKTKNNKIIVIDGGGDSDSGTYAGKKYPKKEIEELLKVLKGATGQQVPTVDAWIFTHCHSDHVNVFSHLMNNMAGTVKVGKVYYNFPSDQYLYNAGMGKDENSTLSKFKRAINTLSKNQIVIVEQGKSYTVDNVTFNIILAPDESIKDATFLSNAINESSLVFDMKLGGQRVLFLGDLGPYSNSRFLAAIRKTESETVDVVQLGHHGSQGLTISYYWALRPKACLWSTPTWLWNNDNGKGYNTGPWETITLYNYLVRKGVDKHYVMKDGTLKLEFPLDLG